uniref:Uncharacterized protein n=1 Tax=Knipowitschia caucasica TaxID=637954 RepID=A0AAV2KHD3_KNICA
MAATLNSSIRRGRRQSQRWAPRTAGHGTPLPTGKFQSENFGIQDEKGKVGFGFGKSSGTLDRVPGPRQEVRVTDVDPASAPSPETHHRMMRHHKCTLRSVCGTDERTPPAFVCSS